MRDVEGDEGPSGPQEPILMEARQLIERLQANGIVVRALGGVAIAMLCPSAWSGPLKRSYGDLDIATPKRDARRLAEQLQEWGFIPDQRFNALHGRSRMIFESPRQGWRIDVFVEEFAMCHTLPLGKRLAMLPLTVTRADLLLTKTQIVELNQKDAGDIAALLLDSQLSDDESGLNTRYVSELLARDWGWWRTVTSNLAWVGGVVPDLGLEQGAVSSLEEAIRKIRVAIDAQPKSLRWRTRASVGDRVPWYEEPEEVR